MVEGFGKNHPVPDLHRDTPPSKGGELALRFEIYGKAKSRYQLSPCKGGVPRSGEEVKRGTRNLAAPTFRYPSPPDELSKLRFPLFKKGVLRNEAGDLLNPVENDHIANHTNIPLL